MWVQPHWQRAVKPGESAPHTEWLNHLLLPNFAEYFRYTHSDAHSLSGELIQNDSISQQTGAVQGGVITLCCETVSNMAAALCVPDGYSCVCTSIHTHYVKLARGTLTLTARPVHCGRTQSTWTVTVTDESGSVCSVCTATFAQARAKSSV